MTAGCKWYWQQQGTTECEPSARRTTSNAGRRRRTTRCTPAGNNNHVIRSPNAIVIAAPNAIVIAASPVQMDTDSCEAPKIHMDTDSCEAPKFQMDADICQVSDAELIRGVGIALSSMATLAEGKPIQRTPFHSIRVPGVSIESYMARISKFFHCSTGCYILALIYIDRIIKCSPGFVVCNSNVHRLLITAMVLAAKNHDDEYYSNAFYAKVGGVVGTELNSLELRFLQTLKWKLHVTTEEYNMYRQMVSTTVATAGSN